MSTENRKPEVEEVEEENKCDVCETEPCICCPNCVLPECVCCPDCGCYKCVCEYYYADFDESGNIKTFYVSTIHGDDIPESAILITEDEWRIYSEDAGKYKLDGETIREKTEAELQAEEEAKPKPPPSRVELLETENANLWYEVMLEKSRNDNHDADIAQLYYDMMMGGVGA